MRATRKVALGFTLVELLVVIGIIAILIAILLPTIAAANRTAKATACLSNLRSIGQALKIYQAENNGAYPYAYYIAGTPVSGAAVSGDGGEDPIDAQTYVWWSVLRGVMRGKGAPLDNSVVMENGGKATRFMAAFNCPMGNNREAGCDFIANAAVFLIYDLEKPTASNAYAHAINKRLARPPTDKLVPPDSVIIWDGPELAFLSDPFTRQYIASYRIDVPNYPSGRGGMLADPKTPSARYRGISDASDPTRGDSYPINPGPNREVSAGGDDATGNIRWRHGRNDSANFLFADGSAKTLPINKRIGAAAHEFKGEVTRKMFRIKLPPGYSPATLP